MTTTNANGDLLTLAEAARLCRVSVPTFRTWCATGKIPRLRLTKKAVRVRHSDLREFLRSAEATK